MPKRNQQKTFQELSKRRDSVFARFPLVFTLLGALGVTITYYGLQHLIDKVPVISSRPYIAVIVGLLILLFTGTLYKRLG